METYGYVRSFDYRVASYGGADSGAASEAVASKVLLGHGSRLGASRPKSLRVAERSV